MALEEVVTIEKLVHGGQGLGTLADGRKVFVWNALPGEKVHVRVLKGKRSYAEAIADEIIEPSPERIEPVEPASYMATSPWQILNFEAENRYKREIVQELFAREHVGIPPFELAGTGGTTGYRNKMEYGFWGDDDGISLAHFVRGSHGKTKVTGSMLANDALNAAAAAIVKELQRLKVRAGDVKSLIVRTNREGKAVAALFVKRKDFKHLVKPDNLVGFVTYYSDPKSPASVATKELQRVGDTTLSDTLNGRTLRYDVLSFYQANIDIFEQALLDIKARVSEDDKVVDMYAGVGTIGLSLGIKDLTLVEIEPANTAMAKFNAAHLGLAQGTPAKVVTASSEKALESISGHSTIIFDPPRAGLHKKIIQALIEVRPPKIIYLSCNPATQARDIALLNEAYKVVDFKAYNFFPRTPHIESLAILERN